jgi:hypothetical protein
MGQELLVGISTGQPAPTTSTVGYLGQVMFDTNGIEWKLADIDIDTYIWVKTGFAKLTTNAFASGGVITLNPGMSYTAENVSLASNTRIIGNGATITATGNNSCFVADSKSNITIEDVNFVGTGNSTQKLLSFTRTTDYDSIKIINCKFSTASGVGLYFIGCGYVTRKPSFVTGCEFDTCGIGIQTDTRAEFITISNCHFHHCTIALQKKSGNIDIVGCNFLANTTALKYINGTNEAHANVKACAFEHNATQILATGVLVGEYFGDCRFFEGNIDIVDCVNWLFSDCYIAVTNLRFDTCVNTKFQSCIFNRQGDGYGNTITTAWDSDSSGGSHISQVWWLGNFEETAAGVRTRLTIGGEVPTGVPYQPSGLQIWEKEFNTTPPTGTTFSLAHNVTGIGDVVDLKGTLNKGSGDYRQFPNIATTSNYYGRYVSSENLIFNATSGYFNNTATLYINFSYTKNWS